MADEKIVPNKPKKKKKTHRFSRHVKKLGFTNRLAIYLLIFLLIGLAGGFFLALYSIQKEYTGALACWTVVFTPIGTAVSIVLQKIVDKSKAENTGPNGEGIVFAAAKENNFVEEPDPEDYSQNSLPI